MQTVSVQLQGCGIAGWPQDWPAIEAFVQCRAHDNGVTIQGAISAASAVATAACQAEEYPLPQTMLLQCPASVRKQVGLHFVPGLEACQPCTASTHDTCMGVQRYRAEQRPGEATHPMRMGYASGCTASLGFQALMPCCSYSQALSAVHSTTGCRQYAECL